MADSVMKKLDAMRDMSRTIREESARHAPHITALPDEVLEGYIEIVGAYLGDFKQEKERRDNGVKSAPRIT